LVRFLWENLGAARVLLLCTATGELDEADPWFVEGGERKGLVRLRPLSDEDTRALAQELTKRAGPLPEPLLHLLCARALGHPLRVEQLLTILFHHKVIDASALPWTVHLDRLEGVALPDSAQGLARARLESLEPRERRLLALAALFGGDSWVEAVVCLDRLGRPPAPLDLDEQPWPGGAEDQRAREALEGLVGRDLLRVRADTALAGCRGLYFKHEIERRLALELAELSGPERARLHAVCAQWLEIASRRTQARRPVLRLLAQHHELAGHPERAARAWTEAGQEEAAQHRHHDARACFEQAQRLATADELELRLDILHGLGGALERLSEHERASQSYAEFLEVAAGLGHRSKVAVGFNKLGRVRRALGRYEAALQLLQRAKALFEEAHDLDGVAASQDDVGQVYAYQGRYEEAEACFRTALELRPQEGDPRARALALHHLGAVRMGLGDFKEALALMRQALELRRAVGDRRGVASTLNNLAVIFHQRGELPEARTLFVEAATIAHELGDRSLRAVLLNNLGEIALMLGDLDAARQDLQQAEALSQELGERHTRFDALLNLGKLAQRSGEHDHAARYTEEALGCARELGSKEQEGVALRALGDVRAATLFVDDFARQGQAEGSAQECYQESIRLLAEVGNAAEHGRSLSAYGNWLLERGMVVQGRQQLEQAKDIFSRLEMKKSLQKTEQLINEL
jgi:tetratricopeptide (TPR) repeat protein